MSGLLLFDVVEQILVKLDVIDLIRCKNVCKAWRSLISSNRFIKAHLNHHTYNNNNNISSSGGHTRILFRVSECFTEIRLFSFCACHIVGSSNGLVCFSPSFTQLSITNPSTRELKTLPDPQGYRLYREYIFFGFGYDSSADDYKVILGSSVGGQPHSSFHLLTLKSNTWKFIGDVNYTFTSTRSGILCNGAIHWFMNHQPSNKKVILSFNLSSEEFKEIPQPDDMSYEPNVDHMVGLFEEYLCIYKYHSYHSTKWVMKKYNVQESWELSSSTMRYRGVEDYVRTALRQYGIYQPTDGNYICGPIFVQSLVSPHMNNDNTNYVETLVSPHVNNNLSLKKKRQKRNNRRRCVKLKRKRQDKNNKRKSKGPNLLSCKKKKKNI